MRIKSLVITAVLATAILCFGAPANTSATGCMVGLSSLSAADQITCLQETISNLMAQIQVLQTQLGTTPAWCHTFNTNLGYANSGTAEVGYLHTALGKEGISYGTDGINEYSEPTMSAVVQFQAKYGISQSGYVGPLTRAKLNSLYGCQTVCAQDMYTCPNGVSVSRTGSNCEFVCPPTTCSTVNNTCTAFKQCCPGLVCGPFEIESTTPVDGGTCVLPSSVTINSVSGPNSLNVSQTGTWTVNATAPSGTNLTYSVDWGDNYSPITGVKMASAPVSQTSTFTHSYSQAGTYTVKFTVMNQCVTLGGTCPASTNSAQTSITVAVGQDQTITALLAQISALVQQINNICNPIPPTPAIPINPTVAQLQQIIATLQAQILSCQSTPRITVTSPNGGEQWARGSTYNITWTSMGLSKYPGFPITITVQNVSGATVYTTSYNIGSTEGGSVSWLVPNNLSYGQYKVKLDPVLPSYSGDDGIWDMSDNYFSIVAAGTPSITVTSPSVGQSFNKGNTITINWTPANVGIQEIDLVPTTYGPSFIVSGGKLTQPNTSGTSSYIIDNMVPLGNYYLNFWPSNGSAVISSQIFSIVAAGTPSITVTSPNGGETWEIGKTYTIRWTSANTDLVNIYLESWGTAGGGAYAGGPLTWQIAQNIFAANGSQSWTIPTNITPSISVGALYKIRITNSTNAVITDSSDNYFSIVAATTGACSDTDGGSNGGSNIYTKGILTILGNSGSLTDSCQIMTGVASYVSADSCSGTTCYIEEAYCGSPSRSYRLFPADYIPCPQGCSNGACVSGTCTPNWQTSAWSTCVNSQQTRTVTDSNNCGVTTNKPATTQACTTTPSITITSPNGGQIFTAGQNVNITWSSIGLLPTDKINIWIADCSVSCEANQGMVITNLPGNSMSYNWTMPLNLTVGTKYKINLEVSRPGVPTMLTEDMSDNYFSIVAPTVNQPTITNIVPSSGTAGSAITIYGTNLTGASSIIFYQNGVYKFTLSAYNISAISSNQFTLNIDNIIATNFASITPYNISVVTPSGTSTQNGPLSIVAATVIAPTNVTYSPTGNWVKGTSKTISWTTSAFTSNVEVWLCTQSNVSVGMSVAQVANTYCSIRLGNNLVNTGSVAFTTPASAVTGTTYYFYVRKYGDSPNTYAGNAFSGPVTVTDVPTNSCTDSDNGKNYYLKGTTYGRGQRGYGPEIINWEDTCSGDGKSVIEFSCKTLTYPSSDPLDVWNNSYDCTQEGKICQNGFCVAPGVGLNYSQSSLASIADAIAKITAEIQAILLNK